MRNGYQQGVYIQNIQTAHITQYQKKQKKKKPKKKKMGRRPEKALSQRHTDG